MSDLFWFSDAQWTRIEPMLPTNTRGLKRVDDRRVLSGIVHVIHSDGRCAERGIWEDIFTALPGAQDPPRDRWLRRPCVMAISSGNACGYKATRRCLD